MSWAKEKDNECTQAEKSPEAYVFRSSPNQPTNQPELEFHCLIANTLARKVVTVEIGPFVQVLFRFTRFEEQGSPGKTPLSVLFFGIRYYYSSGIRANSYCSTSIGLAAT